MAATSIYWPEYTLNDPQNFLFDANITEFARADPDIYRAEAIAYMSYLFSNVYNQGTE